MEKNEQLEKVSRRTLLCSGLATAVLGFVPAANAAGVKQLSGNKIQVDLSKNPTLNKIGSALVIPLSDGNSVALVRTKAGNSGLSAISLACTHQGATVQEVGNRWICPLHGSQYTLAGKVVQGPANFNLPNFPLTVKKNIATFVIQ